MNEILASLDALSSLQSNKLDDIGFLAFGLILLTSAVASYVASLLYLGFYGGNATGSQIHRAFPLLGVSITAIFISIQFSLPLSLGLLGALSIVRFRTPIKEPEEIGFIMLVVALSISCAIFNLQFVVLLLLISFLSLVYLKFIGFPVRAASKDGLVVTSFPRVPEGFEVQRVTELVAENMAKCELESVSDDDTGMVLSYRISGGRNLDVDKLRAGVKQIEAGASAELYLNHS